MKMGRRKMSEVQGNRDKAPSVHYMSHGVGLNGKF